MSLRRRHSDARGFDELAVVGDLVADPRSLSVSFEEQATKKNLGCLGEVEAVAGDCFGDELIGVDPLDRIGDGHGQERRAVLASGREDGVDQLGAQTGPGGVMDGDILALGIDHFESAGDQCRSVLFPLR